MRFFVLYLLTLLLFSAQSFALEIGFGYTVPLGYRSEADIKNDLSELASLGITHIRWNLAIPPEQQEVMSLDDYISYLRNQVNEFVNVLPLIEQFGFKEVVLDVHSSFGMFIRKDLPVTALATDKLAQRKFANLWMEIARLLKSKRYILFEILNEPAMSIREWTNLWLAAAVSVWTVDEERKILLSARYGHASKLKSIERIAQVLPSQYRENVILSANFWNPISFTHNCLNDNLKKQQNGTLNRERLAEDMNSAVQQITSLRKRGYQIYITEIGVCASTNNSDARTYIKYVLNQLTKAGVLAVFIHAWRSARVWDFRTAFYQNIPYGRLSILDVLLGPKNVLYDLVTRLLKRQILRR